MKPIICSGEKLAMLVKYYKKLRSVKIKIKDKNKIRVVINTPVLVSLVIFFVIFLASHTHAQTPWGKLTVYAHGPYEVWGGNRELHDRCYDAPNLGYNFLGKANSTHTFYVGNYRYIVVATRSLFKLDAIKRPDGLFLGHEGWQGVFCGNVHRPYKYDENGNLIGYRTDYSHTEYIYGPPDGLTEDVGIPPEDGSTTGAPFQGFVVMQNLHPLIIIPGILGSSLHFEDRELWPGGPDFNESDFLRLQYQCEGGSCTPITPGITPGHLLSVSYGTKSTGLIGKLIEEGYTLYDPSKPLEQQMNANLFLFPYDWRKPIEEIAEDLASFINSTVRRIWGNTKIDIIAHSMGGLVTKAWLLSHTSEQNIGKIIMVGVPHLGSPQAYVSLKYSGPWPLAWIPWIWGYKAKSMKIVARNLPSVYELLPSEEYFNIDYLWAPQLEKLQEQGVMIINGYIRDPLDQDQYGYNAENPNELLDFEKTCHFLKHAVETYIPLDPPLDKLNSFLIDKAQMFHSKIDTLTWRIPSDVEAFLIAGSGVPTIGVVREHKKRWWKSVFGKPKIDIEYCNGDGTVPLWSAVGVRADNVRFYYTRGATHGKLLMKDFVQRLILNILGGNYEEDIPKISLMPFNYSGRTITVYSPVGLIVYDSHGNETGCADGTSCVEGIPGSKCVCLGGLEGTKSVFVPNGGTYKIVITSLTDQGDFDLVIKSIENDEVTHTVEFIEIPVTTETRAEILISDDISKSILKLDCENDGVIDNTFSPTFIDNSLTEKDTDNDSIPDRIDNCPNTYNPEQVDSNNNGIGDACEITPGDIDNDGDIDKNDLNILLTYRNQPASACPECDIDGDGIITVLDARKLVLMCTRPRCATEAVTE